jgi:AcrR family transcriptional regulator
MKKHDEPIRQKIIIATINCIEKLGMRGLTVRAIAKEAGVNVAAVNYYFGNKEALLDVLMKQTLDHMVEDIRAMMQGSPRQILEEIFGWLISGAMLYPNMVKAHMYDIFTAGDYKGGFVKRMNPLLEEILVRVSPAIREKDEQGKRDALAQMFYTALFSGVMPDMFRKFRGADLRDRESMDRYIKSILDAYLV